MTTLSARREAAETLHTLLALLDLPQGSRDFLAGFAAGLDLGRKPIRRVFQPIPLVHKSQLMYGAGYEENSPP